MQYFISKLSTAHDDISNVIDYATNTLSKQSVTDHVEDNAAASGADDEVNHLSNIGETSL